jgi:hypothetical protein
MSGSGADDGASGFPRLPQTSVKRRRWRIDAKTRSHYTCDDFLEQEQPLCLMDLGPSVRGARPTGCGAAEKSRDFAPSHAINGRQRLKGDG